jgi:Flp pilus assembly protein TadG
MRIPVVGSWPPQSLAGHNRTKRRGSAIVEFAVIAPLFVLLIFAMIEFGRMIMVKQILTNAAREGARLAVVSGTTDQNVLDKVSTYMTNAGIGSTTQTVSPSLTSAETGDSITVTVSVPYKDVAWLPVDILKWGKDTVLKASVVMRKEG